jgi:hypothetical protein
MLHPHTHPKVTMSKEACAMLTAGRRAKSHNFKTALNEAWDQFNDMTKTIVAAHHKSVCYVQNELYASHGMLHSRRNKLNMWNTFCWKKNQDNNNCKFHHLLRLSMH